MLGGSLGINMKYLLILVLVGGAYAQDITTRYDKFKDASVVTSASRVGLGYFYAYYTYPGQIAPQANDQFYLMFTGRCGRQCNRAREVTFLVDGERIVISGAYELITDRVGLEERAAFAIARADLDRLASAEKVEFRWGRIEGELRDKQKRGMKELLTQK